MASPFGIFHVRIIEKIHFHVSLTSSRLNVTGYCMFKIIFVDNPELFIMSQILLTMEPYYSL